MSLKERLMADLKQAMRDRDTVRLASIRMVRAAVKNAEIDWQREVTDDEVVALIAQEVKRRKEAIEMFRQGRRDDLVAEEQAEMAVLCSYLPEQMSPDEIEETVRQIIADLGATNMKQLGTVMRQAMSQLKGKADGRLVNQIAREILSPPS